MTHMLQMTRKEYFATHRDFRCRLADGTPAVLECDAKTGGTVLCPVEIIPEPKKSA